LSDGSVAILDYKTGRATAASWDGARPDEPQLPLYAVGAAGDVSALAFVQLRAQEVAFKGLAREAGVLPGVPTLAASTFAREHADWAQLMESWRATLTRLAHEYLSGAAPVAPKNYPDTCGHCDLKPLCRVRELMDRGPVAQEGENGGD
jgi:ATP-dependent helicase/nuclease subunit B